MYIISSMKESEVVGERSPGLGVEDLGVFVLGFEGLRLRV